MLRKIYGRSTRKNLTQGTNLILESKEMKKGDKVRTPYGHIETVLKKEGCQVFTYESVRQNNWWHPTKLRPVSSIKKSNKSA